MTTFITIFVCSLCWWSNHTAKAIWSWYACWAVVSWPRMHAGDIALMSW